jgi:hypothetical protein
LRLSARLDRPAFHLVTELRKTIAGVRVINKPVSLLTV